MKESEQIQIESFGGLSRELKVGDNVMAQDYTSTKDNNLVNGKIVQKEGNVIFEVKKPDG